MKALSSFVENRYFQGLVLAVICINAVLFGLQTSASVSAVCGPWLSRLDGVCLAVFTVELVLKRYVELAPTDAEARKALDARAK